MKRLIKYFTPVGVEEKEFAKAAAAKKGKKQNMGKELLILNY